MAEIFSKVQYTEQEVLSIGERRCFHSTYAEIVAATAAPAPHSIILPY
jgi:hypothetical protein